MHTRRDDSTPEHTPSPRWLTYVVLGLATSAALLLCGEVALRAGGISYPLVTDRDDFRGSVRRPGVAWWNTDEGYAFVRINTAGFRDTEWTVEKPANTVRIAVLGDSMVEALQVPLEQRFTELVETQLNERGCFAPRSVDVMNFGQSGYGTAEELMVLRHHVWQYRPDLVVLGVMTGNDISNNFEQLQKDDGRPYFVFENDELVFDDSFRHSSGHIKTWTERAGYAVIDRSRIAQLAYRARAILQKRQAMAQARAVFTDLAADVGLDTLVYKEPADPVWAEAWKVTDALLTTMAREVAAEGADFVAVTLSNTIQVNPDRAARQRLMDKLGISSLSYPDDRIAALGRREGFSVVNFAPAMVEYADTRNAYLHGFSNTPKGAGHWNEEGHRVVAGLLTDTLCARVPGDEDR